MLLGHETAVDRVSQGIQLQFIALIKKFTELTMIKSMRAKEAHH